MCAPILLWNNMMNQYLKKQYINLLNWESGHDCDVICLQTHLYVIVWFQLAYMHCSKITQ